MANPQPDRFTRISNELYEAIMQTDFSKRQRSIIDLIIRASYGCNKRYALLRLSDFEVVGVYKSHIKKEIDYLVRTKVIYRNGEKITLNKDYDQWRVSLAKTSDQEKLGEILRKNLYSEVTETVTDAPDKVTETVTKDALEKDPGVTKTVTDGYQNSNSSVTETVTDAPPSTPMNTGTAGGLKTIKDILKTSTTTTTGSSTYPQGSNSDCIVEFYEKNIGIMSPLIYEKIMAWEEDTEKDLVLLALEKTVLSGKRNFSYAEGILRNWHNAGIKTYKDADAADREFQQQRSSRSRIPLAVVKQPEQLTPEGKKRLEELNIKLEKIAKEIPP